MGQKGARYRSCNLHFKFCDLPNISGTAVDAKLKFYMRIEGNGY